jgi:hypothetical protein
VPNDLLSWELKMRTWLKRRKQGTASIGRHGIPKIELDGSVDEIHLSQFTPNSLRRLLEDSGFEVINESLDPFFAKKGLKLALFQLYYAFHLALHFIFGVNRYNTIWMVGRAK